MTAGVQDIPHAIGRLNEQALHAELKRWYARPGDQLEARVEGYVVDIVRGDLLVEVQTRGFSSIKRKLEELTQRHRVRLVHPIAREKWILRLDPAGGERTSRRKSPKRGSVEGVFDELRSFPRLLESPNFSLEVLVVQEEEIRRHDPACRRRRGGWRTHDRRLLGVLGERLFETPADLATLIPADLEEPFTTSDLADAMAQPRRLAQRMAFCLREMSLLTPVGKRGNTVLYARQAPSVGRGVVVLGSEPLVHDETQAQPS